MLFLINLLLIIYIYIYFNYSHSDTDLMYFTVISAHFNTVAKQLLKLENSFIITTRKCFHKSSFLACFWEFIVPVPEVQTRRNPDYSLVSMTAEKCSPSIMCCLGIVLLVSRRSATNSCTSQASCRLASPHSPDRDVRRSR